MPLTRGGTKCRQAPRLRGEWPLSRQALGCQALQLQTCRLMTQEALDTEPCTSHRPTNMWGLGTAHTLCLGTWRRGSSFLLSLSGGEPPFSQSHVSLIPAHVPMPLQEEDSSSKAAWHMPSTAPAPEPGPGAHLLWSRRCLAFQIQPRNPLCLAQQTSPPLLHHQILLGAQTGLVLIHASLAPDCCLIVLGEATLASLSLPPP